MYVSINVLESSTQNEGIGKVVFFVLTLILHHFWVIESGDLETHRFAPREQYESGYPTIPNQQAERYKTEPYETGLVQRVIMSVFHTQIH